MKNTIQTKIQPQTHLKTLPKCITTAQIPQNELQFKNSTNIATKMNEDRKDSISVVGCSNQLNASKKSSKIETQGESLINL